MDKKLPTTVGQLNPSKYKNTNYFEDSSIFSSAVAFGHVLEESTYDIILQGLIQLKQQDEELTRKELLVSELNQFCFF